MMTVKKVDSPYITLMKKYNEKTYSVDNTFYEKHDLNSEIIQDFTSFEDKLALWIGYYRLYPHVFIKDYFNITLKPFQVYLLYKFFKDPNSFFVGCRGISKTFTTALFLLAYAILYSGTRIIVVSGIKEQAYQTLVKIKEIRNMMPYDVLDYEFEEFRENLNTAQDNVEFSNGSAIKIVASAEGARGQRCQVLVADESAIIPKDIYDAVLVPMGSIGRQPPYLQNPKYSHLQERTKTIMLTSARDESNWNYSLYQTYLENIKRFGNKSTFNLICLPYQVSVKNSLVSKEKLIEQMRDENFDMDTFNMEMGALWSKTIKDGYYSMNKLAECRTLTHPEYPKYLQYEINTEEFNSEDRKEGEIRIISADIALMGSNSKNKNDNTVLTYIVAYPNEKGSHYVREVRYIETISGGVPIDTHALRIRELYSEFKCDYMVLDSNGIGMAIFALLTKSGTHPETGEFMDGYGCINDELMQQLVPDKDSEKVIFSIKASANLNKDMYSDLQSKIIRKQIRLPIDSRQADNIFSQNKKYPEWLTTQNAMYKKILQPYKETDKLIDEMINLQLVDADKIKLKEKSGKRKDRFSSVAYGNYFISTLETDLVRKNNRDWGSFAVSSKSKGYNRLTTY